MNEAQRRKETPIYSGLLKYFPLAIREIARVSFMGSKQHHPDKEIHWDRPKSPDHKDALMRHCVFEENEHKIKL